jgi:uncharacterized repeat protein (TIGR03803 family)
MRGRILVLVAATLMLVGYSWAGSDHILYNFNGYTGDGYYPESALVADAKGNLYGTTYQGGANGYGSVFELSPSGGGWKEKILYSFAASGDGHNPQYSPLLIDKSGNIYGTTAYGGTSTCNCGTVFELTKSGSVWKEIILHSFTSSSINKDGQQPAAGLSFDTAGNMYGTTFYGGVGYGTVFQFQPSKGKWVYKVIHKFTGQATGDYPAGGITQGPDGYYYGTTYYGGNAYNAGTIYRLFLSRGVWVGQTIFYFLEGGDGIYPNSSLTIDSKGNMYGTTYQGGVTENCGGGCGTVYKLTLGKNNTYTHSVIGSFQGADKDGQNPYYGSGVTLDASGNLYGVTEYGGSTENAGTVYKLALQTNGSYKESVLHAFDTVSGDGYYPYGGVILVNGKLYGTTLYGGGHGAGTVYSATP